MRVRWRRKHRKESRVHRFLRILEKRETKKNKSLEEVKCDRRVTIKKTGSSRVKE